MQRVGSGTLRGRVLRSLPAAISGVRPTGARVREAIFDRLQREVVGAAVLDLFAGTGALAIEALSRGAARATLVELQPRVVRFLREQIRELALADRVMLVEGDARDVLRRPPPGYPSPHDLVLLDPPYEQTASLAPSLAAALAAGGWLAREALIVCEYDRSQAPAWPAEFAPEATRTYGQTGVDFLRWTGGEGR